MHYKNGREAKEGDSVIGQAYLGALRPVAGTLYNLNAGSTSCNAQLAVPVPGGIFQACVTIGECYHAEDAFGAIEEKQPAEKVP